MPAETFEIIYAAHTATCTFLLDAEGICRRIVMVPNAKKRDASRNAARCVGAQYVASLDPSAAGCLVEMPRLGASMLFARIDERGRVSLVRTGVVTHFEQKRGEEHDPFDSVSVKTSAPAMPPRAPKTQRVLDGSVPAPAPSVRFKRPIDPDYDDSNDRTQRIQALKPEDFAKIRFDDEPNEEPDDMKTSEYRSAPASALAESMGKRSTLPTEVPPQGATLRAAPRVDPPTVARAVEEEADAYTERTRGMLPRRSEPKSVPAMSKRRSDPRTPRAQAWQQSEPKVATTRRRDR